MNLSNTIEMKVLTTRLLHGLVPVLLYYREVQFLFDGKAIPRLLDTIKVIESNPLNLTCDYNTPDVTYVEWTTGNNMVSRTDAFYIQKIRFEDEGIYICSVKSSNSLTNTTVILEEASIAVKVLYPPSYPILEVPNQALHEEVLTCTSSVKSSPEASYQWKLNNNEGSLFSRNKTLYLKTLFKSFTLFFIAQNLMNPTFGEQKTGYVTLAKYINIHRKAYIASISPRYIEIYTGKKLTVECYATGNPTPDRWWTKTGDNAFIKHGYRYVSYGIGAHETGEYICHAENTVVTSNGTEITTHVSDSIFVNVRRSDDSDSKTKITCRDCLNNYCQEEETGTANMTDLPTSHTSPAPNSNCSESRSSELANENSDRIIALGVVAGIGWLTSGVLLMISCIYRSRNHQKSNDQSVSQNTYQGQITNSVYVSNAPVADNSYTDLTTYDQIHSGTDIWRAPISRQSSNGTYLHPTSTTT